MINLDDKGSFEAHPFYSQHSLITERIRDLDGYDGSIAFVLQIDPDEFSSLRSVGVKKIRNLLRLQDELRVAFGIDASSPDQTKAGDPVDQKRVSDPPEPELQSRSRLNRGLLTKSELNLIRLLERKEDWDGSVKSLLALERVGKSKRSWDTLSCLQARIREDLTQPWLDTGEVISTSLCVNDIPREISIGVLEKVLLTDFERFTSQLAERDRQFLLTRWGCAAENRTLKDLARDYGITESRMSQIEKKLRCDYRQMLSLSPELIRLNLDRYQHRKLSLIFPSLRGFFSGEHALLEFIAVSGGYESRELIDSQCVPAGRGHTALLEHILASNESPIPLTQVLEEIISETGFTRLQTSLCFERYVKEGLVEVTHEGVRPGKVRPHIIATNELLKYPDGLHWKDVIQIIRVRRPDFLEDTRGSDPIRRSPYLYSLGYGFYRHRAFFELDEEHADVILPAIREELKTHSETKARVRQLVASIPVCRNISYFDLRCLISDYAERYGMFFNGQSRADSLSLDPDSKRLDLKHSILDILSEADEPMTRAEIQDRMKHGRGRSVSAALSALVSQGRVVRVQHQLYVARSTLHQQIDLELLRPEVIRVVESDPRPLEADVLREELALRCKVNYSKYVWAFIADEVGRDRRWSIRNTLIHKESLSYASLGKLFAASGNFAAPFAEQVEHLQSLCRVTESTTHGWFRSWVSRKRAFAETQARA